LADESGFADASNDDLAARLCENGNGFFEGLIKTMLKVSKCSRFSAEECAGGFNRFHRNFKITLDLGAMPAV
jgi:hypothetical protein